MDERKRKKMRARYAAISVLLSGCVAGVVSRTSTAPLDRIRVLIQSQVKVEGKPLVSVRQCIKYVWKKEGIKAFFKGNGTNCIKIAPETALKFYLYEETRLLFGIRPGSASILDRFLSGAISGTLTQLVIYPLDVIKTRMAISGSLTHYNGIIDAFTHIIKEEGPKALYKGLLPSLLGMIPYSGVDLGLFSLFRDLYEKYNGGDPSVFTLLLLGSISSVTAQITAYPLHLARTRLQIQGMKGDAINRYSGMLDVFKTIWRLEGIRGYYRGLLPNFLKAIPAMAINYAVYDKMKQFCRNNRPKKL